MKATWRGRVIAESDRTIDVDGYRYFPRENVRMDWLRAVPKNASDRACPNGVQFYDVVEGAETSARAAWVSARCSSAASISTRDRASSARRSAGTVSATTTET